MFTFGILTKDKELFLSKVNKGRNLPVPRPKGLCESQG